ncbi:MAG: rod shape-determining protein MreD [bacterium]
MNIIIVGFILIITVIFQTTLASYLALFGVKPDMLLIIVVYLGFKRGPMFGQMGGFLSGFMEDMFTGNLIGINALSKTIIGNLTGHLKGQLAFENAVTQIVMIAVATACHVLVSFFAQVIFTSYIPSILATIRYTVIAFIYNGLLAVLVFAILDRMGMARGVER